MRTIISLLICLHMALPVAGWAQEMAKQKNPLEYSLSEYGIMLAAALLGGFVGWFNKVRKGELQMFSFFHLVGELATSSFAGLVCFWLCEWANSPLLLTIALVAISGHMGARAVALFEQWATDRFGGLKSSRGEQ
jgi:hypothetical protein